MRLGITIVGDTLENFTHYVQQADRAGVAAIGTGDSQTLYGELWVRCTVAGMHTAQAQVGPWATNPVTRHPSVTAGAAASLAELTHGRAYLGISTGDAAVYNIGRKPATLARLEAYIRTVKALLTEGVAEWEGHTAYLDYPHPPVPIAMPASGPRALHLAGQVADIVWVCTGVQPEAVAAAREHLAQGAAAAGRRLEDLDIWWVALLNVGPSRQEAIEQLKFSLASYAHIIFRYTLEGKAVPPELADAIRQLVDGYQSRFHIQSGEVNPNAQLVDDLDLSDYLADRLTVAGTVDECLERLQALQDAGIDQIWTPVRFADKTQLMQTICDELMPRLPSGDAA
jgi:5,10-methylenetetrahydromethanopterin reductase